MAEKRSLNRITILNIISTVILQGISFFSAPVFSRMMGTSNYGIYVSFLTWVSIFSCVFSLQVSSSLMLASTSIPEEDQDKYQSSILFLSFLSFAAFTLLGLVFKDALNWVLNLPEILYILIFVYSASQMVISFATAKYTAELEAEKNLILSVSSAVLGVLLSLALFFWMEEKHNYLARILGVLIPNAVISLFLCVSIFRQGRTFIKLDYWKACLAISIPFIFHLLSGTVLNQSDRVMIQRMMGDSQAGIYSLAYSYSGIITIIYTALNNSWTPFYINYLAEENYSEIKNRAKNYTELFTVLCLGFVLLSPEVFRLFAGREFWEGSNYINLLVLANYFIFLYSFPVNFEYFCKNSKIIAAGTIAAALFNIVMNYILIFFMGTVGAVISTLMSNILLFFIHYFCATKVFKEHEYPFSMGFFLPYLGILLAVCVILYVLGNNFALVRWSVGAILGLFELRRIVKRKSIL